MPPPRAAGPGDNHDHESMLWLNRYVPVGPIGPRVGTAEVGGHSWDITRAHCSAGVPLHARCGNGSSSMRRRGGGPGRRTPRPRGGQGFRFREEPSRP
ncbi:GH12 family glycosyl hydrolase domain-containing protein [Streptomyces sp. MAR4 CNX-425]|uniref:GH12 family glycosyl hydrolase domain-containing protein n=1 Tax=Streptomyces sp. MAR4 CNX-425 TaxID=3406343 RepID=UPI003B504355